MSLAENILLTLSSDEELLVEEAEEEHIIVEDSRQIIVPKKLRNIAVTGDKDIETVTIDCVRYWDGYDLSTFAIYINYILPNGIEGTYIPSIDKRTEKFFTFDWTIGREITSKKGNLRFSIMAVKTTNGVISQQWSSFPNSEMKIIDGIDLSRPPEEEIDEDIVSQAVSTSNEAKVVANEAKVVANEAKVVANEALSSTLNLHREISPSSVIKAGIYKIKYNRNPVASISIWRINENGEKDYALISVSWNILDDYEQEGSLTFTLKEETNGLSIDTNGINSFYIIEQAELDVGALESKFLEYSVSTPADTIYVNKGKYLVIVRDTYMTPYRYIEVWKQLTNEQDHLTRILKYSGDEEIIELEFEDGWYSFDGVFTSIILTPTTEYKKLVENDLKNIEKSAEQAISMAGQAGDTAEQAKYSADILEKTTIREIVPFDSNIIGKERCFPIREAGTYHIHVEWLQTDTQEDDLYNLFEVTSIDKSGSSMGGSLLTVTNINAKTYDAEITIPDSINEYDAFGIQVDGPYIESVSITTTNSFVASTDRRFEEFKTALGSYINDIDTLLGGDS